MLVRRLYVRWSFNCAACSAVRHGVFNTMYSLAQTEVVNSRRLSRRNEVWRRRKNNNGVVFTTRESVDPNQISVLRDSEVESFNLGTLFLSIYKACDHLDRADQAAWHLSETIIQKLLSELEAETVTPNEIAHTAIAVIKNFDKLAAAKYESYRTKV